MVQTAPGDPPRPTHNEILKDEHAQLDHVKNILSRFRCIVQIAQTDIDKDFFPNGSDVSQVLDAIMMEARGTLMYRRQRWKAGRLMVEEAEEVDKM